MRVIEKCFDCPNTTFKSKEKCICKAIIPGSSKAVNSKDIHPRCPLPIIKGQRVFKKGGNDGQSEY